MSSQIIQISEVRKGSSQILQIGQQLEKLYSCIYNSVKNENREIKKLKNFLCQNSTKIINVFKLNNDSSLKIYWWNLPHFIIFITYTHFNCVNPFTLHFTFHYAFCVLKFKLILFKCLRKLWVCDATSCKFKASCSCLFLRQSWVMVIMLLK